MPPTGKPVQLNGYTVTHFDGDRIAHEEVYFDVLSWMTQLGATLTPPGSNAVKQAAIEAFVEAWNTGDVDKLDASTTENFMRTSPAGMEADSREAMKGVMTALRASYPDVRIVITDTRYDADRAFLNWTIILSVLLCKCILIVTQLVTYFSVITSLLQFPEGALVQEGYAEALLKALKTLGDNFENQDDAWRANLMRPCRLRPPARTALPS